MCVLMGARRVVLARRSGATFCTANTSVDWQAWPAAERLASVPQSPRGMAADDHAWKYVVGLPVTDGTG
jgi:hypothetical protein